MDSAHLPPGWTFTYKEVSNNVYVVRLESRHGPAIEMTGTDVDAILRQAIEATTDIDRQLTELRANRPKK
jgi:hypothetical protein